MDNAERAEFSEHDNARAFDELLQGIHAATDTQRDRSTRFEALISDFLTRDKAMPIAGRELSCTLCIISCV